MGGGYICDTMGWGGIVQLNNHGCGRISGEGGIFERLSEEGKGKQGEGGEKARPQAEQDGVNTCDTFHIISIKFHILINFILHALIMQIILSTVYT